MSIPVTEKPGLGEFHRQRQTDVAEPDDADARGAVLDFLFEHFRGGGGCAGHTMHLRV